MRTAEATIALLQQNEVREEKLWIKAEEEEDISSQSFPPLFAKGEKKNRHQDERIQCTLLSSSQKAIYAPTITPYRCILPPDYQRVARARSF